MSNTLIKNDPAAELRRLEATNFFRDKPVNEPKSSYLLRMAQREAKRFGTMDYLANHYVRLAAYAGLKERRA